MDTTATTRTHRSLLLTAFALIVALLAAFLQPAAAQARTVTPRRSVAEVSISNAVLSLLNSERAANHLKPLTASTQLITSARNHNLAMARANTMSHQVAGEPALGTRETAAGYQWSWAGENIGWNSDMSLPGVLLLQKTMYNEQAPNNGHRLNILNSHFTNIGVDVYLDNTNHRIWLTTDFGRP